MGIVYYTRDLQPAHYLFQIDNFSKLQNTGVEEYHSNIFEAGGYKWRLYLYPNGNKKLGGAGHVSLYLGIEDQKSLPINWRVNVILRMFIKHLNDNKYLTITDDVYERKTWPYDKNTTQWGYAKLISLPIFKNQSKSYLRNDLCVFGVEVFVNEYTGYGESLSINTIDINRNTHMWQFPNFSVQGATHYWSPAFTLGGRSWKLRISPKGWGTGTGKSLGFSLLLNDAQTLTNDRKLYAQYNLTVKNRRDINDKGAPGFLPFQTPALLQLQNTGSSVTSSTWGWVEFMPLTELKDVSKGFLVNDILTVGVTFLSVSVAKDFK